MSKNNILGGHRSKSSGGDEQGLSGFRVSIPASMRPVIQSIRETTGKQHSDEEIYSVLRDCSMDPNETAQKLLYLDTFHEVKKKRDRRKEVQGARGGRGNYYSNSTSFAGGGGRISASRRENGVGLGSRRAKSNTVPHEKNVPTGVPNGPSSLPNGSIKHVNNSELPVDGVSLESKDDVAVDEKKSLTAPRHPIPTFASVIRAEKEKSTSIPNPIPSSVRSASVSASDPREVVSQQKGAESNDIQGNKNITNDVDSKLTMHEKMVLTTSSSISEKEAESKSEVIEKNQPSEPPLVNHGLSLSVDEDLQQGYTAAPKGSATVLVKATSQSLPESTVSDGQNVTFPNHFKVSEAVKNGLIFGSINAGSGLSTTYVNGTSDDTNSASLIESSHTSDETAEEPSTSGQSISSTGQTQTPDNLQSTLPPSADHISTSTNLKPDEPKQELPLLSESHQKPTAQTVPNYGFGLMLPSQPTGQVLQVEGAETQARDVSHMSNFANGNSLAPSTSPAPSAQTSVTASPQPVHLFRQPYPGFLPYGQYLPPYLMPQIHHQFLSPNGLTQQPSAGNLYLQSAAAAAAAAGVKFPLSQFKPTTNAANPAHIGMPSGYGSYGSSPIGFNPLSGGSSGKSNSNEDLAASQLKDNHVYTTGPLTEGSGVWMPAPGQDLSNMQVNPLYNLNLHGPPITFAPPHTGHGHFPGIYQPPQTMTTPSNVNPLLQQSQAMAAAAVEKAGPPSAAFQQQQPPPPQIAQMNWNHSY